jgi:hypothetical protein
MSSAAETIFKPTVIETKPFAGQKPGTSGLRKRVRFTILSTLHTDTVYTNYKYLHFRFPNSSSQTIPKILSSVCSMAASAIRSTVLFFFWAAMVAIFAPKLSMWSSRWLRQMGFVKIKSYY